MSNQGKRQTRQSAMFKLVAQQMESGLNQLHFCEQQAMSVATFSYWRKKYLKYSAQKQSTSPPHFIPIKIKSSARLASPVEIELPNKIILRCTDWQTQPLATLILELQNLPAERAGIEINPKGLC